MKNLYLSFAALSLALLTACNDATPLQGQIKDSSGKPLNGLKLSIDDQVVAITDNEGRFSLDTNAQKILKIKGDQGTGKILLTPTRNNQPIDIVYPVKTEITVLHLNDVHGAIDNFAAIGPQISKIKKERQNVLVFSTGDAFTGNPMIDHSTERGKPIIELFNQIGVQASAIGNHEFDYGQETLNKRMSEAQYPFLSANMEVSSGVLTQPAPFKTFTTTNGVSIAVLGLIENSNNGIPASHPEKVEGIKFNNPLQTAKQYAHLGDENEVFITLSHLGLPDDEKLARTLNNIDVIIGGHSHSKIATTYFVNNTLIAQAGDKANFIGQIDLVLENDRIVSKTSSLIDVKTLTEKDPEIAKKIAEYNNNPVMNEVVATATETLSGKDALGSFICEATAKTLELDMAVIQNGSIRIPTIEAGNVTLKTIYTLMPFSNEIIKMKLTAAELRDLITFSYNKAQKIDLQTAGFKYTVFVNNSMKIKKVELTDLNRQPLDENKQYTVGMNSYIASSYKFTHADPGASTFVADNEALLRYLRAGGSLAVTNPVHATVKIVTE